MAGQAKIDGNPYGYTDFKWLTKDELKDILKRSHAIWSDIATERVELRKTADSLATILAKLGTPVTGTVRSGDAVNQPTGSSGYEASLSWPSTAPKSSTGASSDELDSLSKLGLDSKTRFSIQPGLQMADVPAGHGSGPTLFSPNHQQGNLPLDVNVPGLEVTGEALPGNFDFDASWMSADNMDWVSNIAQKGDELFEIPTC